MLGVATPVQGAATVSRLLPGCVRLFIVADSEAALVSRLGAGCQLSSVPCCTLCASCLVGAASVEPGKLGALASP